MKKLMFCIAVLFATLARAQDTLPLIRLPQNLTLHFISPEPIQYIDISGKALIGDLPLKNIFRIKLKDTADTFKNAVVTITGETYIAQYRIVPGTAADPTEVNIMPVDTRPLDIAGIGLSQNQLKALSLGLIAQSSSAPLEKVNAYGIKGQLNHIYTVGNYIFLDVSYKNKTRLTYDIEDFHFKVDDKKVTKASNVQSVELRPDFILSPIPSFEKYYRNIFVFKKMTFPGNKLFHIELSEKPLSGRVITIGITYKDLLNADSLPN